MSKTRESVQWLGTSPAGGDAVRRSYCLDHHHLHFVALAPGNPATLLNGGHPPSPATIKYFNRLYGFNRPLPIQYLVWLHHLLEGNLGESIATRTSVSSVIIPRIGLTLFLTIYAVAIMVVIGVPLGIVSAVFRSGPTDFFASMVSLTLTAIPTYVTGVVLAVVIRRRAQLVPGPRRR